MIGRKRYCTVTVDVYYDFRCQRAGLAAFIIYDTPNGVPMRFKTSCYIKIDDADLAQFMAVNYAMGLLTLRKWNDCDITVISTPSQIVYDQLRASNASLFYKDVVDDFKQWKANLGTVVIKKLVMHKSAKKQGSVEKVAAWCGLEARSRLTELRARA